MGKTVPIRLNDEQLARVEESAALAGYKHLSTYMGRIEKTEIFVR